MQSAKGRVVSARAGLLRHRSTESGELKHLAKLLVCHLNPRRCKDDFGTHRHNRFPLLVDKKETFQLHLNIIQVVLGRIAKMCVTAESFSYDAKFGKSFAFPFQKKVVFASPSASCFNPSLMRWSFVFAERASVAMAVIPVTPVIVALELALAWGCGTVAPTRPARQV